MKNKLFYPALFHKAEEGGFWVSFPDLPECLTQGENMEDAYSMAIDALGLALEDRIREKDIPAPSTIDTIEYDSNTYPVIVEFDLDLYRRRTNSKAVKKTLSIPAWLNEEAMAHDINFSAVLQEALKQELRRLG